MTDKEEYEEEHSEGNNKYENFDLEKWEDLEVKEKIWAIRCWRLKKSINELKEWY